MGHEMNTALFAPAAVTGQPLFTDTMHAGMGYFDEMHATAYCLDAPELVLAGGARAVVISGIFEGVTPRTVLR
jgi:hypothetical protein